MVRWLFEKVLGVTFLVSGVVKGVDPMGLAYKLEEYLNAFGLSSLDVFSAALSVGLCAVEIALGLLLLLGRWRMVVAVAVGLFMLLFTIVTYEIYTNPYLGITECGCFGDAIELSNGATFWKNIILLSLSIANIIVAFRGRRSQDYRCIKVNVMVLLTSFSLPFYSYYSLPPFDFLGYNVGSDMRDNRSFVIYDKEYNDVTDMQIYRSEKRVYIITARDRLNEKNIDIIAPLIDQRDNGEIDLIAILSDLDNLHNLESKYNIDSFYIDDTTLKSIIRCNRGVIVFEDGIILGKWQINNSSPIFEPNGRKKIVVWSGLYISLLLALFYLNFNPFFKRNL